MKKTKLQYFKFDASEWMIGDITTCTMEAQGLFANLCAFYWMRECVVSLGIVQNKYPEHAHLLNELIDNGVIKSNEDHIVIEFLDEQMVDVKKLSEIRRDAGSKGGQAKSSKCLANGKQLPIYKDKDEDFVLPKKQTKKVFKRTKPSKRENKHRPIFSEYEWFRDDVQKMWDEEWWPLKMEKGCSPSDNAIRRALNKIEKFSDGDYDTALEILTQSVDRGWTDIWGLKTNKKDVNRRGSRNFTSPEGVEYREGVTVR